MELRWISGVGEQYHVMSIQRGRSHAGWEDVVHQYCQTYVHVMRALSKPLAHLLVLAFHLPHHVVHD